jgi:16S rRNA processing protein RimM
MGADIAIEQGNIHATASRLRGARIFIPRSSFPTADPGEYYWVDLIGLAVHNRDGLVLGQVLGLLDTGPQTVLRVGAAEASAADEILIPFVAAYVDSVSLVERLIVVDWGLDY